jgi:hypothetical protein
MYSIGTIALVFSLVTAALLAGFLVLVWLGLRAGDHDDDARVDVRLAWSARPDGHELRAIVDVNNPSPTAAMVSARNSVVPALALMLGEPRSVAVPFRERRRLMSSTMLLGAADSAAPAHWVLPIGLDPDVAGVRVDLRLDQRHRARVMRYLLPVPSLPASAADLFGLRDPQGA